MFKHSKPIIQTWHDEITNNNFVKANVTLFDKNSYSKLF